METLTLNDGTIVRNALTFNAVVGLWIHIKGIDFVEAFKLFSDANKTVKITTDIVLPHKPDEPIVYEGFTVLSSISREDETGDIIIKLKRGEANVVGD